MWKRDLKNVRDRRKEIGGGLKTTGLIVDQFLKLRQRDSMLETKAPLPPQIQALSSTNFPGKSSHFEHPPSSQLQLLAHWGPQPGCGRVCSPAPQSPSPRHRQRSAKRKGPHHFKAAPRNSRGRLLNGPRCNFNISVLPTHSRVQVAMSLMGKALSKSFLLILMKFFLLN